MYFFLQRKLNRLNNKKSKLEYKLKHSTNEAEKTVLTQKLKNVESEIIKTKYEITTKR